MKFRREVAREVDAAPFSKWCIRSTLSDGGVIDLQGYVYDGTDLPEARRYIAAVADGLRRAGFPSEVTLTRESVERLP